MKPSTSNTLQIASLNPSQQEAVEETLHALLQSPLFSSAPRSRRFLEYIVKQHISGNGQSFKERTIGVEVFDRPLDYSTGDDPIVRVQAGIFGAVLSASINFRTPTNYPL